MLKCYTVEPEFEKRRRLCGMGSTSDALEAFWRGLDEAVRSPGGVLEEVLGGHGRSWEACWSPDADLCKKLRFLIPSWGP